VLYALAGSAVSILAVFIDVAREQSVRSVERLLTSGPAGLLLTGAVCILGFMLMIGLMFSVVFPIRATRKAGLISVIASGLLGAVFWYFLNPNEVKETFFPGLINWRLQTEPTSLPDIVLLQSLPARELWSWILSFYLFVILLATFGLAQKQGVMAVPSARLLTLVYLLLVAGVYALSIVWNPAELPYKGVVAPNVRLLTVAACLGATFVAFAWVPLIVHWQRHR
jgi:hypothetical protein